MSKRVTLVTTALILFVMGCNESDDETTPINVEENAGSKISYIRYHKDITLNQPLSNLTSSFATSTEYLFVVDNHSRIIRFNKDLEALDWIGYDSTGVFGIYSLINNTINPPIFNIWLFGINNSKLFFTKSNGTSDTLFSYEFASRQVKVEKPDPFRLGYFGVSDDSFVFGYEHGTNTFNKMKIDETIIKSFKSPQNSVYGGYALHLSSNSIIYAVNNNPGLNTDPYLHVYDVEGNLLVNKLIEFDDPYIVSATIDRNDFYVESWEWVELNSDIKEMSVVKHLDSLGEEKQTYYVDSSDRLWLDLIFDGKFIQLDNNSAPTAVWKVE